MKYERPDWHYELIIRKPAECDFDANEPIPDDVATTHFTGSSSTLEGLCSELAKALSSRYCTQQPNQKENKA